MAAESDAPLTDNEIRALGHEPGRRGWKLTDPDAKPPHRPGLCKECEKFDGNPEWDEICAGCMYFGPGDPHGLWREDLGKAIDEAAS